MSHTTVPTQTGLSCTLFPGLGKQRARHPFLLRSLPSDFTSELLNQESLIWLSGWYLCRNLFFMIIIVFFADDKNHSFWQAFTFIKNFYMYFDFFIFSENVWSLCRWKLQRWDWLQSLRFQMHGFAILTHNLRRWWLCEVVPWLRLQEWKLL